MEVFPCPLGILALRLCRSVAASKSFGHRRGDFSQLADERINLFAPFAVPAKTEPDNRCKRPQVGLERPDRTWQRSVPRLVAFNGRPKVFARYGPRSLVRWLDPIGPVVDGSLPMVLTSVSLVSSHSPLPPLALPCSSNCR